MSKSIFSQSLESAKLSKKLSLNVNFHALAYDMYDSFKEMQKQYANIKNDKLSKNVLEFLLDKDNELKKYLISEKAVNFFEKHDGNNFIMSSFGSFTNELLDVLTEEDVKFIIEFLAYYDNSSSYYNKLSLPKIELDTFNYLKNMISYHYALGDFFISIESFQTTLSMILNLSKEKKELNIHKYLNELFSVTKDFYDKEDKSNINVFNEFVTRLFQLKDVSKELGYELALMAFDIYLQEFKENRKLSPQRLRNLINKSVSLTDILEVSEFTIDNINKENFSKNMEFLDGLNLTIDNNNIKYLMYGYDGKENLINKNVRNVINHIESMELSEELSKFYIKLAHKFNKKKGFLNMLCTLDKTYLTMNSNETEIANLDFSIIHTDLMNVINVNNVNKEMFKLILKTSIDVTTQKHILFSLEEHNIETVTPQELMFLLTNVESHIRKLFFYYYEQGLKVDERLNVLKSLPKDLVIKINSSLKPTDDKEEKQPYFSEYHIVEKIKSFDYKELIHLYKNYKHIPKNVALIIHLFKEEHPLLEGVKSVDDLHFLKSNEGLLEKHEGKSLEEIQMIYINKSIEVKEFKAFLDVKDEKFFEKHFRNLMSFYKRGLITKAMRYATSVRYQEQRDNFKLILKAEIAGRLNEIKFNISDLIDELDMKTIDSTLANKWFENKVIKEGRFTVKEVSDFQTLFEMGENPVNSCMSYNGGMYNHCLLSIFDSNKKIIGVYDGEKLVGRAILRFTKVKAGTINNVSKGIGFKDIEDLDSNNTNQLEIYDESKDLTLFIERLYTNYNNTESQEMRKLIVSLIKQKAKELNVKLTISSDYARANGVQGLTSESLNMFISHSKNGKQYLDSLGGSQDEVAGGRYYPTSSIYMINLD